VGHCLEYCQSGLGVGHCLEYCHLRLLNAQVRVDTGISGSAGEVLVFSVGDMLF